MSKDLYKEGFTQNRELSWLRFNNRVLDEGNDSDVPLLERLKFVSIFDSNLTEFFMVRVGSLKDMLSAREDVIDLRSGLSCKDQLNEIYKAVRRYYKKEAQVYEKIQKDFRENQIFDLKMKELNKDDLKFIRQYFTYHIAPFLSPQIIDSHHPFPYLQNNIVHIGVRLILGTNAYFGIIPVPSNLPDIIVIPGDYLKFVHTEDIISYYIEKVFSDYEILEKTKFTVTRNTDLNPDDDLFDYIEDYRKKMLKVLSKRKHLPVVRLVMSSKASDAFTKFLCEQLKVKTNQIFYTSIPLSLKYGFSLSSHIPNVKDSNYVYPSFEGKNTNAFEYKHNNLDVICKKDILLHFPYHSMQPFLYTIREAAEDPRVTSIQMTIYRLAKKAKLVEYLCRAAENGKQVTVLIELKARFDEQNNIDYSERLEEAGCNVIYGFEDYKVHSKICLITLQQDSRIKYITQVGTGNYNESTAKQYTDLSLMTSNHRIGSDANNFFKNMKVGKLDGHYHTLLVAPYELKPKLLALMDREIAKKTKGNIFIKVNSLTDVDIIEKLKEASTAGVKVTMIIRSITCLLPGVETKTDNIKIISIVGRYLEHSRIYRFGTGQSEKMFISSADFMTRNTTRRVEIACPILDSTIRSEINKIIEVYLSDNTKSKIINGKGKYTTIHSNSPSINAQRTFMDTTEGFVDTQPKKPKVHKKIATVFKTQKIKKKKTVDTKRGK